MKKWMIAMSVAIGFPLLLASSADAAWPTCAYAPPVVAARPVPTTVYRAPVYPKAPVYQVPVSGYRPAPVVYHSAPTVAVPTTAYRPVVSGVPVPYTTYSPYVATPPAYPAAPAATFWSPYGGPEVRVPGQPVRNLLRAIVP